MTGKKGQRWSKAMTSHQRDSIALTKIEKYIDSQIDDVLLCPECKKEHGSIKELSNAAVALIRARYDKLRPTLSAVEQTHHEEPKDEEQLIQELKALFHAKPELLGQLNLVGKPQPVGSDPVVNTPSRSAASPNNPDNDSQQAVSA